MLDTDICIYAMGRRSENVLSHLGSVVGEACMSSICFAELIFGAEKSHRTTENLASAYAFRLVVPVQQFGERAAAHHGQIRAELERRGALCGANDMFIGAHARSLGLTLVTNNRREFDRMPGLRVENWV